MSFRPLPRPLRALPVLSAAFCSLAVASALSCQVQRAAPPPPAAYHFLATGMIPSESIAVVRGRLPFSSITFRRGACFGTCPVYEVTLYRDGRATYSGTRFVARIGHFTGEVHLFDFARLCYLVERQRLDTLAGRYAASWTDAATTTITLSRANNTSIVIEDYGEVAPIEVWGVQQAIDAITAGVRWSQAPTR